MGYSPQYLVDNGHAHLPSRNRTMGNLAKLQDGVPVIMTVIDLMPCREAGEGGGRILLMFQTAVHKVCNLDHWNYVRQVCRSSENIA